MLLKVIDMLLFFFNIFRELFDDFVGSELFMKLSSVFFLRVFYINCLLNFILFYIICYYFN